MKASVLFTLLVVSVSTWAQQKMTPELLWTLGRVSGKGISTDGKNVVYSVTTYDIGRNGSSSKTYAIPLAGGEPQEVASTTGLLPDRTVSPDGKYAIRVKEVPVVKVSGKDIYPDLDKSNVLIYESLNYRHWDTWEDGAFSHLFLHTLGDEGSEEGKDIMEGEPYDCPLKPFGGTSDFTFTPDSKAIVYVAKKKYGTDYAVSTNTDLYRYDIATGTTTNLTEGMEGYDVSPAFSSSGALGWLSMQRDGYESDKQDIIVDGPGGRINLTAAWDGTVSSFTWSSDGRKIYFRAPVDGTIQLFEVDYPGRSRKQPTVKKITDGDFDITSIVGQSGNEMVVTRTDMNHAAELFVVNLRNGSMRQLTEVNKAHYDNLATSKIERRYVTTTDGKKMLVWVIFPPDFDPSKKYPTLLYCQGGPQSPLSQFYSFRWNFQLMAANGYIIVAPSRRGMPGFGVEWNEAISKHHGGQVMQDYLTAIDEVSKEAYVDKDRLGCVGASYGGYSVFYLAGIHEKRFKTFISHDGIFNMKSMYGTTEELWFVNWDYGGPYWDTSNAEAQNTYKQYDPSNIVAQWDTPILIIQGGKDYRVPIGQGLEAFQAAQLQGIKSKLLFFPEENHWILTAQNGIAWQREFFGWLDETLNSTDNRP
ncbi:MAG TPA: S9 family peptidase [Cyclobacteriaceae bacterium]|nr:S9 family peptidase [Cyclobacteriaceae bacterium]